jgi:hypothetical protein
MRLGSGNRERDGLTLVDIAAWIALHAARSALAGAASRKCGNQPFDTPAVVFVHGQFVNEAMRQNRRQHRFNSFNEGQEYEGKLSV